MSDDKLYLLESSREELESVMESIGEPAYRGHQVYQQLYVRHAPSLDAMTDLPLALRERLLEESSYSTLRLEKERSCDDGMTRKALFELPDGSPVETVLMVYPDRATVCVSSQSGCPLQCTFCATGKLGLLQHLTPGQIVHQVLWAVWTLKTMGESDLTNVVFMGMGEPFNNYRRWWEAVERLHDPDGFNMGARSFTVSTVGLIPGIEKLANESLPVNLAVSLHAPNDEIRSDLMPINRRYPMKDLLQATRDYINKTRRRVSFEYILLQEKNDEPGHAEELALRLREGHDPKQALLFHVNLIPWNPVPGTPLSRSHRRRVLAFQEVLKEKGIPCTVRVERGVEIDAACGQLAGMVAQ